MPLGGAPKTAIKRAMAKPAGGGGNVQGGFPGAVRNNPAAGGGGGGGVIARGPFGAKLQAPKKPVGAGPVAPPAGGPGAIPDIEAYLAGDQTYQGGISDILASLARYKAQNQFQADNVRSAFDTASQRMEKEKLRALTSLKDDFASRGMLNSGLYLKANDDYNEQFTQRLGDLQFDLQGQLNNLDFERANNEGISQSEQARLRQAALARRAQQFGIM